jgi:alkylation response protein AidB-like acyl-CoA dehydrogenase
MERASRDAASPAVPDSRGINLFHADPSFAPLLKHYLGDKLHAHLAPHFERMGMLAGGALDELATLADANPPVLHTRTRRGEDKASIERHPAYLELERVAFAEYGLAAMSHRGGVLGWPEPLPPAAKYALTYLFVQAEFGLCCPLSMTDSLTRTLVKFGSPELVARYLPALTATDLEHLMQGAMFITEQGAGSDVGSIATRAREEDGEWKLYGEKWFCSNVDAGVAMVLARPEGGTMGTKGLALFLLPRELADGRPNNYRVLRLKNKLGSRSMPSGEIRLEGATAYLVGDAGRGFAQMTDMINMSRLSNGMRAAGMMRRALTEALFVARNRSAFGRRLIELPLMQRQLLKLMLPAEQARSMVLHASILLGRADAGDAGAQQLIRVVTPLIKFRACRDARKVAGDAMEVRGGCGYIEEWSDARLLRDAHLGSIWEGTSNIVALDVMRALRRDAAGDALEQDLRSRIAALKRPPVAFRTLLESTLGRVMVIAREAATGGAAVGERAGAESLARQAASALYHLASAVVMAQEADAVPDDVRRVLLAKLVLEHRVLPRDPLHAADPWREAALAGALLGEAPLADKHLSDI